MDSLWICFRLFNGLSVGSILLLVALGLAFSFGLMGVINMAHGEFIMVGAYVAYVRPEQMCRVVLPRRPCSACTFRAGASRSLPRGVAIGLLLERR